MADRGGLGRIDGTAVLRSLPFAAAIVGPDVQISSANAGWLEDGVELDDVDEAVASILRGERARYDLELAPGVGQDRWRQVRASALGDAVLLTVHDVTARRMLEAALRDQEGIESQTGLVDGSGTIEVLSRRLAVARQRGLPLALAQIDVEGLADLRAQRGAPAASELMAQLVARVRRATRDDDVLCRIAEDRMLLIFSGLGEVGLGQLAARLRSVVRAPCTVGGLPTSVDAAVGGVVVEPGSSAQDALDAVDDDLRARRHEATGSERTIEMADRRTVPPRAEPAAPSEEVNGAGRLVPLHRTTDGRPVGAELTGPAPSLLDDLRTAGSLVAAWRQTAPDATPLVVVGLPVDWTDRPDRAIGELREALDRGVVPAANLALRVTGAQLAGAGGPSGAMGRLSALGVRLLLDDADAGVPLSDLVAAPIDLVRVAIGDAGADRRLSVRTAVLTAVVASAAVLGRDVVASGIDPERDVPGLARLGVGLAQPSGSAAWSTADLLGALRAPVHPTADAVAVDSGDTDDRDELDAAFRAVAHEVRTPLTVTMGYASLLEQSADPTAAASAAAIRRAATRIDRMLRALEDVRMLDQDELVLELRDLDLGALVAEVVREQRDLVGLPVVLRSDDAETVEAPVRGDEVRVAQVLTNLISNAARFSPPGVDVEVRLVREADRAPGWARVEVADAGPGIPASQLPRVFAKYGRADRSQPGAGLGLYLARGVARAHGGDIEYRHRGGGGSVFGLVLPVEDRSPTPPSSDR